MLKILENLPENDPLAIPEQREVIDGIITENRELPGATMVVLNELQSRIGFISAPMQAYVAREMGIPISTVHGVVSFYSFFTTQPRGKHTIKFCLGTACYVGGIDQLIEKARQHLGIGPGETTKDGMVTLEICRCVGACSQAPVLVVDDEISGRVRPNKIPQIMKKVEK
ncbi:MAG TPA: NAD(P)H-dependent oxidoreductase subunit E [Anaerolineaceae bacterium]|nr:NAD(P)H-dependent oxidoreductase subunit E [Anaerolineaceae bacterium]